MIAALAVTVLSVRCSPSQPPIDRYPVADEPVSTEPPPVPDPAVDMTDPEAVCEAFAVALHSSPVEDWAAGYRQAATYAADLLTTELVNDRGRRRPVEWDGGDAGRDNLEIGPYAGHLPPDRDGLAHRAVVVRIAGGATEPGSRVPRWIVYCTLRNVGEQWRVAAYEREPRP